MKNKAVGNGIRLGDLADKVGLAVRGSADVLIKGLAPLDHGEPGCIAFSANNSVRRLGAMLAKSPISALILKSDVDISKLPDTISYLTSADPLRSFIDLVPLFYEPYPRSTTISASASIHESARIGKNVAIGDFVSIGPDCVVGDGATLHPQVVLYPEVVIGAGATIHAGAIIRERCQIGEKAIIQNGAIIGADGFGYIADPQEGVRAVPQVGFVSLGARVEVGANSCIDRGAFGNTSIGLGTKVDNLVQIGHNVRVGTFSFICGQAAIAGSAVIGNQVTIGGNVGVAGHLEIHDKIRVAGNSGVVNTLSEPGDYGGFPAQPAAAWRRQMAGLRRLPDIIARLRKEKSPERLKHEKGKA